MNSTSQSIKILLIGVVVIVFLSFQTSRAERLLLPFLTADDQSNITVTAAPEHEKPCPQEYTNLISNTNLFTFAEQELLARIPEKYKSVTTNVGPLGTVFRGIEMRQWKIERPHPVAMTFAVSCFTHTNSNALEEIGWYAGTVIVIFREQSGDGYNVQLSQGKLLQYQEYKNGALDGLLMKSLFKADHCSEWARFEKGKIIGKFIGWSETGKINMDAEFEKPFDLLKYTIGKFDLSWDEVPSIRTNSANGSVPTGVSPDIGNGR